MHKDKFNSYDQRNPRAVQIKQAAYDLITKMPYDDITMTLIAERANVAKGTISNYFNSKEDIFMAIDLSGYLTFCQRVEHELEAITIETKDELKVFLLTMTKILTKEFSVIVLIHSLRRFTLEAHADPIQTEQGRLRIYETLTSVSEKLLQNIPDVELETVMHTFIIQGAMLNGLLTFMDINKFNDVNLAAEMTAAEIAVETEICEIFGLYLDKALEM